MNRESIRTAAAALVLTLAPGGASAQSLAEIARQEKARRAAIAPEDRAPVLTNDDLRGSGGLTVGTLPPTAVPRAAPRWSSRSSRWWMLPLPRS